MRSLSVPRGAALVIGLILLMILTILAFTGVNGSITELAIANNEQFRSNAVAASSTGIEQAIPQLVAVPSVRGVAPTVVGPITLTDSTTDRYTTQSRYIGEENNLPQSSVDKFIGLHYVIDSAGNSARNARDSQTQGIMVVAASGNGGSQSFTRVGAGLP